MRYLVEACNFIPFYISCRFILIGVAKHTILNHTQSHVKCIYELIACFYCGHVIFLRKRWTPKKKKELTGATKLYLTHYTLHYYNVFRNLVFRLSAFLLFSACSVFRFRRHKLYNISVFIVYVGFRYSVILFSLHKKQYVITCFEIIKTCFQMRGLEL